MGLLCLCGNAEFRFLYFSIPRFLFWHYVRLSILPDPDQETETVAQPPPPKPVEPVVASSKVVGGKYVPPGKRGGDSGSTPSGPSSRSYKKKSAPQINNEQEFPSLAASSDLAKHTWVGHLIRHQCHELTHTLASGWLCENRSYDFILVLQTNMNFIYCSLSLSRFNL